MGFAEALADDGKLSGRGARFMPGLVCGLMTFGGGIGHTLPYLSAFLYRDRRRLHRLVVELLTIAWIQWRFMHSPCRAGAKSCLGRTRTCRGILIGSS